MTHRRAVALMVLVTLMWSIAGVVTRHLEAAEERDVVSERCVAVVGPAMTRPIDRLLIDRAMHDSRVLREAPVMVAIERFGGAVEQLISLRGRVELDPRLSCRRVDPEPDETSDGEARDH